LLRRRTELLGYLYVSIASLIWGSNGIIVNTVSLDAYTIAFFRVLIASLVLSPLLFFTRKRDILEAAKAWRSIIILGICLSAGWTLLFQSMKLIDIASAVLLNYMAPVFVALFSPIFLKEKMEKMTVFALSLCIIGMLTISYEQGFAESLNMLGVLLGLLAGLSYAVFIIISKATVANYSGTAIAFYSYLVCTLLLSPLLLMGISLPEDLASWILLITLGVFNTAFAVTLYLKGLKRIKAQKAIIFTYLEPLGAVIFGYHFLLQKPTPYIIIGGALILFASYLTASK
jgi:drug/metabolite transporter (DMT)-like permease